MSPVMFLPYHSADKAGHRERISADHPWNYIFLPEPPPSCFLPQTKGGGAFVRVFCFLMPGRDSHFPQTSGNMEDSRAQEKSSKESPSLPFPNRSKMN